jgi:hypothetical protein
MVADALPRDIRALSGVPLCVLPMFERILQGAKARGMAATNLAELWPNLAAYTYSGAAIAGLETRLRELIGPKVPFFEVYSASESPIAYQLHVDQPGMLLDLRHCFFEFQLAGEPLDSRRYTVAEVEPHTPYRILLTTLGGRFCYRLGDVVELTSTRPFIIRVLGREQEELNIGYERIPLHLVRAALDRASTETGARIHNFFVCPTENAEVHPAHEWHVEFGAPPTSATAFASALDRAMMDLHDRYAFARKNDHMLAAPALVEMPVGTIERFVLGSREFGLGKFNAIYNVRERARGVLDFSAGAAAA